MNNSAAAAVKPLQRKIIASAASSATESHLRGLSPEVTTLIQQFTKIQKRELIATSATLEGYSQYIFIFRSVQAFDPYNMLLEESPSSLLRATLNNFSTAPDRAAVARINDSLSTLQTSRSMRIGDSENALRKLNRQLATVSSQHRDAINVHDTQRHASEIVELDTRKFRVAKQAQELEVEGERLESELGRLKRRMDELEAQGVEGDVAARRQREADDPTILRLWLYRSLGISLEQDSAGNYNKATVSNTRKGDVHVVNIDGKFSKHFYADYFWSTMQG